MHVGVIGQIHPDYFADNICDALRRTGHVVTEFGPARDVPEYGMLGVGLNQARQLLPRLDERAQRGIADKVLAAGCDAVINIDSRLMPSVVARIRQGGARVAFWFPDAVLNFGRGLMILAPYDALFFKEPHMVDRLHAMLDSPVYYLPQACNPRWHRPLVPAGTEPYLVIAGNMYPSRLRVLERLMAKGIPLRLYGTGFPRWAGDSPVHAAHMGRSVFREDKARVFRSAAAVLNTLHPAEIAGVNVRLFEAAGCGAAVLTEYRATLPELFDVDREVLSFRDFDELISQAVRLLNDPGLRASIGDAASERAHSDHTYDLRVSEILEKIL